MPAYNPFAANAFNALSVTRAINRVPTTYLKIGAMGMFRARGVTTTTIMVYERNGQLVLLPTGVRGGAPNVTTREKRKARHFEIPHIPHQDHISPEDIQNLLRFGSENALETTANWLAERLTENKMLHEQTHEYHRMGAIQGVVYDADGTTVLHDWFSEFGITQKVIDFQLDVNTTDVRAKCLELKRHIERNLQGEVMNGVTVLVEEAFFDAFTSHPNVQKPYENWQAAAQRLGEDMRSGFMFAGVNFIEYDPRTQAPDGNTLKYIASGQGHAFPTGTRTTFDAVAAPGSFNETVNKLGRVFYAKIEAAKFGRGYDLWSESNIIHMCTRPDILVKVTI